MQTTAAVSIANDVQKKNFHSTNLSTPTTDSEHSKAELLILRVLQQLQIIYDDACKTCTQTITIKKAAFEAIGNGL